MSSRIAYCAACAAQEHGVKSRIALEHTCGLEAGEMPGSQLLQTKPTIDDMNVVIAAFEGRKFYGKHTIDKYGEGTGNALPEMKYHTLWDWLMPVGKKIYDLLAEMMKARPAHTACQGDVLEVDIHCHIREYNLKGAHEAIYQFITWYNQQTTTNEPK